MKNEILTQLNQPQELEKLYRTNKGSFKTVFNEMYPSIKGNVIADFWYERLNYETREINLRADRELLFVLIGALLAGLMAKLPAIFALDAEFFYPRNIGFIIFPVLSGYFAWKNKLSTGKIAFIAAITVICVIYMNALPDKETDTLILSFIHLPLVLWSVLGFAFVGEKHNNVHRRLGFLKYNGDLVVISALVVIAGGIMSAITIGLFSLIGYHIEVFYFENIVVFGLAAVPIVGTYLIRTNPQLVGKVSPVIAKIFSPLVLVMLVIYLAAMVYSGKNPYNDREFLLIFNALLIGVMAIIFFSIAETSGTQKTRSEILVLFLLSIVTVIVNGIALSAILFRIAEWGITPNRAAVLGGNLLILVNLLLVTAQLYKAYSNRSDVSGVGKVTSIYLPLYFLWTVIVTFLFPIMFGFN